MVYYGFTAFFDPLVHEFGWSHTQISFAMSLRGVEMSVLAPLIGFLVDHYGARRLALGGIVSVALGLFMLSAAHSLWFFYVCFLVISFGCSASTAQIFMQVVTHWFRKKSGLAFGVLTSGYGASGLLIPLVVQVIDGCGWRTAVVIFGAGMLVVGLPLVWLIRDSPADCGLCPDGEAEPAAVAGEEKDVRESDRGVPFRAAIRQRAFLCLAAGEGLRMMAVSAVVAHIMPFLETLHFPRATAGLIAGLITILSIIGRLSFGWLSDYFDKRHIISVAFGLMSLGVFALCGVHSLWILLLFLAVFPAGFGGAITLRAALLQGYFGREAFGRLLGLVMGASALGGMIGPTLAGFIFDTTGSYYPAWISLGIASSATVLLMLSVPANQKKLS